jgi:heme-degrading monooxygenase HmoA
MIASYFLYSQIVHAVLPPDAWDEAYFSLLSLKHALAGVPGWKRMDIMADNHDDGTIHLQVTTNWANVEQLEAWLKSDLTVEGVLKALTPPPIEMNVHFMEKIS